MKNRILFLILVVPLFVNAKTIFVATNGNDTNDGSRSNPFATFDKAVSIMTAGDVCIVRGGTYEQTLTVRKSGRVGQYLTFKAAPGEQVIITATKKVSEWSLHQGSIYKTNVTMDQGLSNQVYYNQELMQIARWPNDQDGDRFTVDAKPVTKQGSRSHIQTSGIPSINWDGAYVWYLGGHTGASWIRRASRITENRIEFPSLIEKWPYNPHNPMVFRTNGKYGRYYLFGKLEILDNGREWFYDENQKVLYFQTPDGSKPADGSVEVPVRNRCVLVEGQYVKIEGFEIFGGNVFMRGANGILLNNKIVHGRERLDEIPNDDAQINDASVEVAGRNTIIKGNEILHGSVNGIYLYNWRGNGANDAIIEGNTIKYFDAAGIHATPIRCTASGVKIVKNEISHTGRDGMFVVGDNCEIAYNDISFAQLINDDSGVFYTVGNQNDRNIEIHHNWIHDSFGPDYGNKKAAGIYLDNDSKGFLVHHNVVWNISWTGVQVNWAIWNNKIYHNTIWNASSAFDSWINGREQKNNRFWNNYSNTPIAEKMINNSAYDLRNNVINRNNPFEDLAKRNFMPKANSSLVDGGRRISDFDKTFMGSNPDVGAYERGGTLWTAGINAIVDTGEPTLSTDTFVSLDTNTIAIAPNPANTTFSVHVPDALQQNITDILMYSIQGKLVKQFAYRGTKNTYDISGLASGTYVIQVTGVKDMFTTKLVKL